MGRSKPHTRLPLPPHTTPATTPPHRPLAALERACHAPRNQAPAYPPFGAVPLHPRKTTALERPAPKEARQPHVHRGTPDAVEISMPCRLGTSQGHRHTRGCQSTTPTVQSSWARPLAGRVATLPAHAVAQLPCYGAAGAVMRPTGTAGHPAALLLARTCGVMWAAACKGHAIATRPTAKKALAHADDCRELLLDLCVRVSAALQSTRSAGFGTCTSAAAEPGAPCASLMSARHPHP